MLPQDPVVLLSVVNTKLRDQYDSLEELCAAEDAEQETVTEKMAALGYQYSAEQNRFI